MTTPVKRTKTRRNEAQRWYQRRCGHREYAPGGASWDVAACLTCGEATDVVSEQGPKTLEDLLRF